MRGLKTSGRQQFFQNFLSDLHGLVGHPGCFIARKSLRNKIINVTTNFSKQQHGGSGITPPAATPHALQNLKMLK